MIITISLILRYKNYLIDEEKSEVTVEKYVRDIETFYKWTEGRKLTKSLVIEYKNKLVNEYSPATVNSVLAALNGFFAYNEWYALKVKSLKLQRQLFCQSEKELTKAEYEKLLKAARDKKNERIYDGALYRIHKGVLYKDDTVISLPSAPGYDQFVVGDFGCWVTGSAFNVAYMSSDIDDPNKWEETPKTFPIFDNSGNLHFAEIEERGEYFDHIIDGISVLKVQHGYFPYNDRFYIYDENVYYVYKRVLYVVSLKNGHISEKSYSVDRILSVGHDAIYFCIGDRIIKESISSKKMFECTLSLPSSESLSASDVCYIDSYHDTVYIFDCDDETVKCSIATFNELIS